MRRPAQRSIVFASVCGAAALLGAPGFAPGLALGLAPAFAQDAAPARIDRFEPPNWWTGFADGTLQLLIHGDNIAALEPSVSGASGVTLSHVERVESPNYLFVYLDIAAGAEPGAVDIALRDDAGETQASVAYELLARDPELPARQGFGPEDAIYLITPDRFANGAPENDAVEGLEDGLDRADDYGRHGGDLAGVAAHLDYIAGLGMTQLWLNPVLENAMAEQSYHGYAQTDLYRIDPRYGSNADYVALSEAARAHGLGLIMDVVLNHVGSGHWWMDDPPSADWINHGGAFVETTHLRTPLQDPYATDVDRAAFADGWFVSAMPDLNQRNPLLADYLIQNTLWWIETAGLAGARLDTYPYADLDFLGAWMDRLALEYPAFTTVGEDWINDPAVVAYWQRAAHELPEGRPLSRSMMDFPLHDAMNRALTENEGWASGFVALYERMVDDRLYADPMALTIFVDNHDMDRIHTQLGNDVALTRMAYVWLATMRGVPQLYYGGEVLAANASPHDHGEIRSEFPGGWDDHAANAFTGEGLEEDAAQMQAFVRALFTWRRGASAVHGGRLVHYAPLLERHDDETMSRPLYVYFREDDAQTVMVVLHKGAAPHELDLDRYAEMLEGRTSARDVLSGETHALADGLVIPPRSALVFEIE